MVGKSGLATHLITSDHATFSSHRITNNMPGKLGKTLDNYWSFVQILSRICPTTLSIRALEFELSFRYCIRPNKGVTRMLISYCLRQLIIDSDNCKSGSSHVYVFKSLAYCLTSFICKPWKSLSASLFFLICSHIWQRQFFPMEDAQLRT